MGWLRPYHPRRWWNGHGKFISTRRDGGMVNAEIEREISTIHSRYVVALDSNWVLGHFHGTSNLRHNIYMYAFTRRY